MMLEDGQVLIRSKREALDAAVRLGIRQGMMYRLLGRPMLGSSGFLDSNSVSESGKVARERELIAGTPSSSRTLKGFSRHELTQMDAQECVKSSRSMSSVHRSAEVTADASNAVGAKFSSSKGAATTDGMMDLEKDSSGGTRSTSLAKRES
jgi:hypothetical protein